MDYFTLVNKYNISWVEFNTLCITYNYFEKKKGVMNHSTIVLTDYYYCKCSLNAVYVVTVFSEILVLTFMQWY